MGESNEKIVTREEEKKEDSDVVADEQSSNNVEEVIPEILDAETEDENDEVTNLKQEIARIKKEKEADYDRMLRIQAEFDNYKRRSQKEKMAERKYKSQALASELLPAIDNFERALQVEESEDAASILKGVEMVYNQMMEAFKSQNIEVIETVGQEFDPNLHHAVMQVEDEEVESNIVVEELQKGYLLEDRVIRAAMVKVNK